MGVPLPNIKKIVIPNKFITAVALKTAIQLSVISKIYPARYTPRNPENKNIYSYIGYGIIFPYSFNIFISWLCNINVISNLLLLQ